MGRKKGQARKKRSAPSDPGAAVGGNANEDLHRQRTGKRRKVGDTNGNRANKVVAVADNRDNADESTPNNQAVAHRAKNDEKIGAHGKEKPPGAIPSAVSSPVRNCEQSPVGRQNKKKNNAEPNSVGKKEKEKNKNSKNEDSKKSNGAPTKEKDVGAIAAVRSSPGGDCQQNSVGKGKKKKDKNKNAENKGSEKNTSTPGKEKADCAIAPSGYCKKGSVVKKMNTRSKDKESAYGGDDRIIFLEERVRIHEATLEAWRQRKKELVAQEELTVEKTRHLLRKRDELIQKQKTMEDARARQLSLQKELKESLAASRDRLRRLMMLENEAEPVEGQPQKRKTCEDEKGDEMCSSLTMGNAPRTGSSQGCTIVEEHFDKNNACEIRAPGRDVLQGKDSMNESLTVVENESDWPLIFNPYQKLDDLRLYYSAFSCLRERRGLYTFLPHLNASQVRNYLTLMLRETNAIDRLDNLSNTSNTQNHNRSSRLHLLENTCLDVLLLVPNVSHNQGGKARNRIGNDEKDTNNNKAIEKDIEGKLEGSGPYSIDPNIPLCPYELAGVCADDLCPYQHINRDIKVLERERLPLPSLSSFLSKKVVPEELPERVPNTSNLRSTVKSKHALCAESNAVQIGRDEEDLMALPPSSSSSDCHEHETTKVAKLDEFGGSGGCDSRIDSDGAFEAEGVPLNNPLQTTIATDSNDRHGIMGSFWWNKEFPIGQSDESQRTNDKAWPDAGKHELSIQDTLRETFGLVIHTYPDTSKDTAIPNTLLNVSMTENKLEIKFYSDRRPNDSIIEERLRQMMHFGRMIDASRLALHGGLDCIAFTIVRQLKESEIARNNSLNRLVSLMGIQISYCRFYDGPKHLSCFETAFASQIGLSISSWCVAAKARILQSPIGSVKETQVTDESSITLDEICITCWEQLCHFGVERNSNSFKPFDGAKLKEYLYNDDLWDNTNGGDITKNVEPNTSIDLLINVPSLMLWSRSNTSIPLSNKLDVSEQQLEERLNATWLIAANFLKDYRRQRCSKFNGSPEIKKWNWELQCLKVSIVMGYAVLGALTTFASFVESGNEKGAGRDGAGGQSSITAVNLAAWTVLDGAVARILKDLRKCVADTLPLMDVILAPIYACSVASTTFLRKYSAAQKRLTECLGGDSSHGITGSHQSTSLMTYSELLWSQLVQLRMSLPNDSPPSAMNESSVVANKGIVPGAKQAVETCDGKTNQFAWEPSEAVKQENELFVTKLESIGIRLRHVVLLGDWMLSPLQEMDGLKGISPLLPRPPKKVERRVVWRLGKGPVWPELSQCDRGNVRIVGSHQYPPPSPLPQLPLQLLHGGNLLEVLMINRSGLTRLPESFALYFPNLVELRLSKNRLKGLPESFRGIPQRMKHLKVLDVSHNQIESLPPGIFCHDATAGVRSQSSPLTCLYLARNNLTALPSMENLNNLQVLTLRSNLLVDMTAEDWSCLTLKLPSLRKLDYKIQRKKEFVCFKKTV